jgi:hypothetical protein
LDKTHCLDLDSDSLDQAGTGFDCVVIGDLLEHLQSPERLLQKLAEITTDDVTLAACVPNMGHISVLERMLAGDLSYDSQGLLDRTHLRFFTPSALFKMLLDAGWLPALHDKYLAGHPNPALLRTLLVTAGTLGVPAATAKKSLLTYQAIVRCTKRAAVTVPETVPRISVIVPVTNDTQFNLNVVASPGLREIAAEVIPCRGARTAAEALQQGAARASGNWYVFCHQDVYFPVGSGYELARRLAQVAPAEAPATILGFAGLSLDRDGRAQRSGLVLDIDSLFDYPSSTSAISLDELAVVVGRDTRWKVDENLGWHLWGTDLCLQALFDRSGPKFAEVVRIPLYHNSFNDGTLSESFHESAKRLAAKYPQLTGIPTLCGMLSGSGIASSEALPADTTAESVAQLMREGKPQEALRLLDGAIARGETAELWNDWATVQCGCGNAGQAERGYRRALGLDGADRQAAVNLGLLLFAQGRLQEGIPLVEQHQSTLTEEEKQAIRELAARFQLPAVPHREASSVLNATE